MNNEGIVYLLRKTSLNLQDIGRLAPKQFNELLKELYYEESVDEYRRQHGTASLLAAIYNTIPRKRGSKVFKASDFLKGDMPLRNPQPQDTIEKIAEQHGIELPTKELKKR